MRRISIIFLIVSALLLLGPRAAGADDASDLASLETRSLGVGLEERAEAPAGYGAKLVFASPKGEYYAGVQVTLRKGKESKTVFSEGPWLLIRGASGRYAVEARAGAASGRGAFTLPRKGQATVVIRLEEKTRPRGMN